VDAENATSDVVFREYDPQKKRDECLTCSRRSILPDDTDELTSTGGKERNTSYGVNVCMSNHTLTMAYEGFHLHLGVGSHILAYTLISGNNAATFAAGEFKSEIPRLRHMPMRRVMAVQLQSPFARVSSHTCVFEEDHPVT
jgi:hypothetical protein